ncbi:MAG: hypothetical protein NVSMB27_30070 [Ktedonobacteraceae bacterium]
MSFPYTRISYEVYDTRPSAGKDATPHVPGKKLHPLIEDDFDPKESGYLLNRKQNTADDEVRAQTRGTLKRTRCYIQHAQYR